VIAWLGAVLLILAAALLVYSIVGACMGRTMLDWKIVTLSVWGVGGLILVCLGLVGEYVGRAFMGTKKLPRYTSATRRLRDGDRRQRGVGLSGLFSERDSGSFWRPLLCVSKSMGQIFSLTGACGENRDGAAIDSATAI
jgi:hypothetical protein